MNLHWMRPRLVVSFANKVINVQVARENGTKRKSSPKAPIRLLWGGGFVPYTPIVLRRLYRRRNPIRTGLGKYSSHSVRSCQSRSTNFLLRARNGLLICVRSEEPEIEFVLRIYLQAKRYHLYKFCGILSVNNIKPVVSTVVWACNENVN